MSHVVGIDPGTRCGWAVIDEDSGEREASGCWDLGPKRHEGAGMRYVRARLRMTELLDAYRPTAVIYEEVRSHKGTSAAHVYGGIVAQLTALCEDLEVPYTAVPVGTVKKHATGKGNAGKAAMIAAAVDRWPVDPGIGSDEADALWIADTWRVHR